jgi:hypothetical protein
MCEDEVMRSLSKQEAHGIPALLKSGCAKYDPSASGAVMSGLVGLIWFS